MTTTAMPPSGAKMLLLLTALLPASIAKMLLVMFLAAELARVATVIAPKPHG